MHHDKIRKLFFEYFKSKGHKQLPDASLIPAGHDPSTLFTSSGMHALKPYFLGLQKPPAKRLFNIQRTIRTGDIDCVGQDGRHLTFFFMLGNWSIGDYGIEGASQMAYEFVTKWLKFNPNKLWISVYKGDKKSIKAWLDVGFPRKRIIELGAKENFWSSGPTGLCGPTSEIYYDLGARVGCGKKNCKLGCDCDRWCEIWNPGVQIIYNKDSKGKLHPLKIQSIDGGAGLERIATVLQGETDIFMTSLLKPIIKQIERLSGKSYSRNKRAMRIVADHLRASVFIAYEGIVPGKKDRSYVLRQLLRRMIIYANQLGINKKGVKSLVSFVISFYLEEYLHLGRKNKIVHSTIEKEYDNFIKTLNKGERMLLNLIKKSKTLKGVDVFHLYDTYGFPMELTRELAKEHGAKVDEKGYYKHFAEHRERSKAGLKGEFKSGLASHSGKVLKYHTANHLLLTALQKVLGRSVQQRGSNLTDERLRFDFSWGDKMTPEQIKKTEVLVNKWIKEKLPIKFEEMSLAQAKKSGAQGIFEHKYGNKIKVYSIGKISKEICGGPHVKNTGELGRFKIVKEKSSSGGVRRIRAILE